MAQKETKQQKKRDEVTIMFLPRGGGSVRKFVFSTKKQDWFKRGIALFCVLLFGMIGYTALTVSHIPEFLQLRQKVALQKEYLLKTNHRLEELQGQLDRIRIFEQKVRIVLGQSPTANSVELVGIGGPNSEDLNYLITGNNPEFFDRIENGLNNTKLEGLLTEVGVQELHTLMEDQSSLLASTPSIWPARGWVTSKFGNRLSPFTGLPSQHHGLDIAARSGTPIKSPADGVVIYASIAGGYGKVVLIDHGYDVTTRYGHLSEFNVAVGQKVRRGDIIGKVGNTGRSTAPHLHYEVRVRSVPVDPLQYILLD